MNGQRWRVAGHAVKLVCSCVRNPARFLDGTEKLVLVNPAPRDGDLVLVRCMDSSGAYDHVEDTAGAPVKLYRGDVFLATLGTRRSGTNLMGEVPREPLHAGDRLDLVAQGGLIAACVAVPAYYGARALQVEVLGFAADVGAVRNVAQAPEIPVARVQPPRLGKLIIFVAGTSAEVGKTTMVCALNVAAKARFPALRTAAIKACGTGRARDALHYLAANYDVATDFVDAGVVSTYGMPPEAFTIMLRTLIHHCEERADMIVVEIGGDFLEARAPEALAVMADMEAPNVMMVNDAMGALEGLRQLQQLGCGPARIGTFRQNPHALAARLGVSPDQVIDSKDSTAVDRLVGELLSGHTARSGQATPEALAESNGQAAVRSGRGGSR